MPEQDASAFSEYLKQKYQDNKPTGGGSQFSEYLKSKYSGQGAVAASAPADEVLPEKLEGESDVDFVLRNIQEQVRGVVRPIQKKIWGGSAPEDVIPNVATSAVKMLASPTEAVKPLANVPANFMAQGKGMWEMIKGGESPMFNPFGYKERQTWNDAVMRKAQEENPEAFTTNQELAGELPEAKKGERNLLTGAFDLATFVPNFMSALAQDPIKAVSERPLDTLMIFAPVAKGLVKKAIHAEYLTGADMNAIFKEAADKGMPGMPKDVVIPKEFKIDFAGMRNLDMSTPPWFEPQETPKMSFPGPTEPMSPAVMQARSRAKAREAWISAHPNRDAGPFPQFEDAPVVGPKHITLDNLNIPLRENPVNALESKLRDMAITSDRKPGDITTWAEELTGVDPNRPWRNVDVSLPGEVAPPVAEVRADPIIPKIEPPPPAPSNLMEDTMGEIRDVIAKPNIKPSAPIAETSIKQPWEMTREEFSRPDAWVLKNRNEILAEAERLHAANPQPTDNSGWRGTFAQALESNAQLKQDAYLSKADAIDAWKARTTEINNSIEKKLAAMDIPRKPWESKFSPAEDIIKNRHRKVIEKAIKEKLPVPPEVLAEYPDLAAKVKPSVGIKPSEISSPEPSVAPLDSIRQSYQAEHTAIDKWLQDETSRLQSERGKSPSREKRERIDTKYRELKDEYRGKTSSLSNKYRSIIESHPEEIARREASALKARELQNNSLENDARIKAEQDALDRGKIDSLGGKSPVVAQIDKDVLSLEGIRKRATRKSTLDAIDSKLSSLKAQKDRVESIYAPPNPPTPNPTKPTNILANAKAKGKKPFMDGPVAQTYQFVDDSGRPISYGEAMRRKKADGAGHISIEKEGKPAIFVAAPPKEKPGAIPEFAKGAEPLKGFKKPGAILGVDLGVGGEAANAFIRAGKEAASIVAQRFHSPEAVFRKDPIAYANWKLSDHQDFALSKFLDREAREAQKFGKDLRVSDPVFTATTKTRDAKVNMADFATKSIDEMAQINAAKEIGLDAAEINAIKKNAGKAIEWDKFLDQKYDYLLRAYGKDRLGAAGEAEMWSFVDEYRKAGENPTPAQRLRFDKKLESFSAADAEVFDIYKRQIDKYITHVFKVDELEAFMRQELDHSAQLLKTQAPGSSDFTRTQAYMADLNKSIKGLAGKASVPMNLLPKGVRMKFFAPRKGAAEGYVASSLEAYQTYLFNIGRKIFDEPVARAFNDNMAAIDPKLRKYAGEYISEYMGLNKKPIDRYLAGIRSFQWFRTLGFNPRSAIVNLTQNVNVFTAAPRHIAKGFEWARTAEGKAAFNESGLALKVPEQLYEMQKRGILENKAMTAGETGGALVMKNIGEAAGYMFSKVEEGNLRLGFSTGWQQGLAKGLTGEALAKHALDFATKVHYRYGRVGSPLALRHSGGVIFQFWSYPVKTMEFLGKMWREDPKKVLLWVATAEGINLTTQELLDTDLSNALGFGIRWGHMFEAVKAFADGNGKAGIENLADAIPLLRGKGGAGILPFGPGPAIQQAADIWKILTNAKGAPSPLSLVLPMGPARVAQTGAALLKGPDAQGKYPVKNIETGNTQYKDNLRQILTRPFIKPEAETRRSEDVGQRYRVDQQYSDLRKKAADLYIRGKREESSKIIRDNKLPSLTGQDIKGAVDRREGNKASDKPVPARERAFYHRMTNK